MSEWEKVKLGELCEFLNGGAWSDKEYTLEGIPVLKVTNCKNNGFALDEISYLPYESASKYSKNKLQKNDVIIATVGSHPNLVNSSAGRSSIVNSFVEGFYLNQNAVCVRTLDDKVLNQLYFAYHSKYFRFQHFIQMRGKGAANQMRIAIGAIKDYPIPVPPIEVQHRIATILSRYDSLIENYQRQIKLLEEAAQRLYKEWFIDLHFPGHENTNIIDGVPEGWEDTNVNGIVTFHRGYDLTHSEMIDGKYPVIGSTSIIGTHKDYKIKGPGIVTGRSGSLGKFQLIQSDFWPHNTTLYISDFKGHDVYYIYCMLNRLDFASLNNGGAIPTLNRNVLSNISVLEPDCKIQKEFTKIVTPMFVKIENISSQLRLLTEARDRLLPKLMSGAIEV